MSDMERAESAEETRVRIEENERFWQRLVEEDAAADTANGVLPTDGAPEAESAAVEGAASAGKGDDLTFEEAVERLSAAVRLTPRFREIYLKLLDFCRERRGLAEAEREVEGYPEYPYAAQPAYMLIRTMVDKGGLEWLEIAHDGSLVAPEDKEGLAEDEVDDLIAEFAVKTTPVGEQVCEEMSPERRLNDLLEKVPQRAGTYLDVMEFCSEPRTYKEVHDLLQGRDVLKLTANSDNQPLQPSFFLDMLERSGGLVWKDGWTVTEKGKALLGRMGRAGA